MANKIPNIFDEMDEKTDQPMKFSQVLFLQCNRIAMTFTEQSGDFISSVEILDALLAWHMMNDEKIKDDMAELDKQTETQIKNRLGIDGKLRPWDQSSISLARTIEKMKILVRLMGRAGFLGEGQTDFKEKV